MDKIALRRRNLRTAIDAENKKLGFKSDISFCEHFDLNPSHISQLINGHGSFGERAARNLEKKIGWIEGLLDEMDINDSSTESMSLDNNINLSNKIYLDGQPIPVISWVAAGSFSPIETVLKGVEVAEYLPPNKDCGKNGYGLIVTGSSMSPKFEPGDRIYINPDIQTFDLQTDDLVIVACAGESEATFKKLIIEGANRYLEPLNPDWPDKIIKLSEDCRLVGKVVGLYRKI